jgi:hypothetical protein
MLSVTIENQRQLIIIIYTGDVWVNSIGITCKLLQIEGLMLKLEEGYWP